MDGPDDVLLSETSGVIATQSGSSGSAVRLRLPRSAVARSPQPLSTPPPCGRASLRGRRRCAPHAPSAPFVRTTRAFPTEEPATTPATPRGADLNETRGNRGTSHNGRALCAAPSAASGRSPRCRPSWLTYPVRRSSGGVEARPDTESAGIPADGLAKRRFETRGLPFCFGRPPGPRRAPGARAIVRPCRGELRLPDRRGLAARGLRRWPRLRAEGAGAGIPHLPGLAGGGRRRCPAGNARPADFRTHGLIGVFIMPLAGSRHHEPPAVLFAPTRTAAESSTPSPIALRGARLQKRGPGWPGGHRRRHERRPVAALGRAAPPSARPATAQPWRVARPSVARRFIGRLPWRRRPLEEAAPLLRAAAFAGFRDTLARSRFFSAATRRRHPRAA
jgi:hypothetical protein